MNHLREAAKQALEVLESHATHGPLPGRCPVREAEYALRAALAQQEQEPVAHTGDVARRMREAEMTFHLGMPHAVVMQQMTRFHDLVCAEASLRAAAAFATPPRRETEREPGVCGRCGGLVYDPVVVQQEQAPVAWTDRELELIDGMIEVQLRHAAQCDAIANRPMAERQKGWDMERVALLRKIKSISPRHEMVAATRAAIARAEGEKT